MRIAFGMVPFTLPKYSMNKFTLLATALTAGVLASASAHANIVADPSFELGAGAGSPWVQTSANFGTPLCAVVDCGSAGDTVGPRTGDWFAWFGGTSALEAASVAQLVTLADGTASLSFWFSHAAGANANDYIEVVLNTTPVWRYDGNGALLGQGYTEITVNLDAFATGATYALSFYSQSGLDGIVSNFLVDDISVVTAPIPEPGTYGLMALGLAGLLVARRRAAQR